MTEAVQDEGDMALKALLSTTGTEPLDPKLREQARRVAARHFGAGGDLPAGLLAEGAIVGHYQVERILGMGGQAVVYLGRHVRLKSRLVAIKIPHGTETYRMLREADVMARLDHPGVVSILDLDAEADTPYLVLDYCTGGSLADRIEAEGPLHEDEVLRVTRELLEALRFAHLREVIHRDLKPENVLFDASGQSQIADFGLGKIVAEQVSLSLSQASRTGIAGTPLYMAPEQERPGAPVDARADLYALGKLIYSMLTGESPRTLRPVEHLRPGLELPWSDLVFALTETFPDARPADADAVLTILESWRPEGTVAPQVAPLESKSSAKVHQSAAKVDQVRGGPAAASQEPLTPGQEWHARFQDLFDRITGNLGYALAFLFAVGGIFVLAAGEEAGVVPLVFSGILASVTGLISSGKGKSADEIAAIFVEERAKVAQEERQRLEHQTPGKSALATFCAVLAVMTSLVTFFTAMGGTIALVLGEDEGIVALIVSGFFFMATLILLGVRRHLERRAARRHDRWGPIDAPTQEVQSGVNPGPGPVYGAPTPIVLPTPEAIHRPTGEDPLPRA
jgi:eukaryotic-like serine/threonine-protein kinase